ncbi:uncharacterized protein LOC141686417 [Apium graveolens]|uniref:uncharacterized protein LOC141686417 n=1 Tax=Apium graveolens TaxID=4045 RepID=UPI003D7A0F88
MCLGVDRVKKAKVQTFKLEFESLKMKESEQLDDFCYKLNSLVANIRALGEAIDEEYVVKKLLRAIPTKFLQISSTNEQFGDLEKMTIEETVGLLKACEEHLKGPTDSGVGQLLLTEEEWSKRENEESQLLLTKEEWQRRSNLKNKANGGDSRTKEWNHGTRDKSKVQCFNCLAYDYYAANYRKPKRDKEQLESNLVLTHDEEAALLS